MYARVTSMVSQLAELGLFFVAAAAIVVGLLGLR